MPVKPGRLVTVLFACALAVSARDGREGSVLIPEGTHVPLKFAQSISSRSTRPGQAVEFAVAEDVILDGVVVFQKDARALGYVVTSSSPGHGAKGGSLAIEVKQVRANRTLVNVRGDQSTVEKRSVGKTVGLTILFGLSGYLLSGGKQAEIKIDTPITAIVAEDTYAVPYRVATPPAELAPPAISSPQTPFQGP